MRFFHLGARRPRSGASRPRLELTSGDPGVAPDLGSALVSSGRDLDARKRGRRDPRSKTGMLELTPAVVFRIDPGKTQKHVFGDP